MRKLLNKKKGFIPLIITPMVAVIAAVLILLLLIGAFFALEKLLFIAIVVALVGAGAYLAIQGQPQPGLVLIIVGLGIYLLPQLGVVELTWFKSGNNIVDIDVNNQNQLTYDVTNTQELKGAIGVMALFDGDDFKRADYFYTKTNGNKPRASIYTSRFSTVINLTDYLEPGEHTIKVCREVTSHYADRSYYSIDEYWNMKKCGYDWKNRGYNKAKLDQVTKKFNFKWLPCSKTKTGSYNPILPENKLGDYGDPPKTESFHYDSLTPEEIAMFADLECEQFEVTIPGTADQVIEPGVIDDGNSSDDVPSPQENTHWWDRLVAFFANLQFSV